MVSRRDFLGIAAAGTAALRHRLAETLGAGSQSCATPVNFQVPAGACDCHVHVFGVAKRFPFSPDRPYTPPPAPVDELRKMQGALHMTRVVVVTPAVYGTNNECTLDAIQQLGPQARGPAGIDADQRTGMAHPGQHAPVDCRSTAGPNLEPAP